MDTNSFKAIVKEAGSPDAAANAIALVWSLEALVRLPGVDPKLFISALHAVTDEGITQVRGAKGVAQPLLREIVAAIYGITRGRQARHGAHPRAD